MEAGCSKCGSDEFKLIMTPELVHFAKLVCLKCGAYWRWIPDPGTASGGKQYLKKMDDGDYELTFGMHAGERLSTVAQEDRDYVDWMIWKGDFSEEIQEICAATLKEVGV